MSKPRILVVDDNLLNLKLATDVLEWSGYEIVQAADAAQALAAIHAQPPGLILMDIGLPDIDGLTLTRRLKADAATRTIPVIALTAFAMKGDEERALEAGCDGYISKPIDTRALPDQVARWLPGGETP